MAAVAIFGLIYTVLARVGVQGLRAEGEADRRVRASLLADNRFGELEAQLLAGGELPIAESEDEVDEFTVYSAVSALELEIPLPPEAATKRKRDAVGGGGNAEPKDEDTVAGSFFTGAGAGKPPPMRKLEVRVVWTEGVGERDVRRTGFGFDRVAAEPLLAALDEASAAAESATQGESDDAATTGEGTPESSAATTKTSKSKTGSKSTTGSKSKTSTSRREAAASSKTQTTR